MVKICKLPSVERYYIDVGGDFLSPSGDLVGLVLGNRNSFPSIVEAEKVIYASSYFKEYCDTNLNAFHGWYASAMGILVVEVNYIKNNKIYTPEGHEILLDICKLVPPAPKEAESWDALECAVYNRDIDQVKVIVSNW